MIRVAIIGYGVAGSSFHAPLIRRTPGMTLKFIVTADARRAGLAAKDFPEARVLPVVSELWLRPHEFDLVVVATPPSTHAGLARTALELDIPAVVDKPATVTCDELEGLIQIAERRKVPMSIFHNRRWDSDFLTARNVIESGAVGRVFRFESRWELYDPIVFATWKDTTEVGEGGGVLYSIGSHLIDQACVLFGRPAVISASLRTVRDGSAADDDTVVELAFDNYACIAWVSMSLTTVAAGPRFRIVGTDGVYVDPDDDPMRTRSDAPPQPVLYRTDDEGRPQRTEVTRIPGEPTSFYSLMVAAVETGSPVPVSPTDVLATVRAIEVARELSRRNGESYRSER